MSEPLAACYVGFSDDDKRRLRACRSSCNQCKSSVVASLSLMTILSPWSEASVVLHCSIILRCPPRPTRILINGSFAHIRSGWNSELTAMKFVSKIAKSLYRMMWNVFQYLEPSRHRRGSPVWQTDGRTDRQADRMAFRNNKV